MSDTPAKPPDEAKDPVPDALSVVLFGVASPPPAPPVEPPAASGAGLSPAVVRSDRHLAAVRRECGVRGKNLIVLMAARGYDIVAVQGVRTDEEQLAIWKHGRELRDGAWVVTGETRTNAMTAKDTPHGAGAALDFAFLLQGKLVGPRPGKGNDSWDLDLPWHVLGEIGESLGFMWGGRFRPIDKATGLGWDPGHFQLKDWRLLK